ncbi:hepatocellular carcinoma-associated antigen 59-domain-containing protein [Rhexocercosporidium sp. MPI-PUGE-AT-0058]|nr:hepatocellular carcinoma-associated antigen 59-domain-containing protein [Rhexocercosporidium sp. MPI-PUGE-AT-0058]
MSTSPVPAPLPAPELSNAPLFRPSKKRKIYRQRAATDDEPAPLSSLSPPTQAVPTSPLPTAQSLDELISTASASSPQNDDTSTPSEAVSMAEILRLRKKNKSRGGVEFKASGHVARDEEGELILRPEDEEGVDAPEVSGVPRKFAPQTGTVGDVNRHMMAYIDSELAKRNAPEGSQASSLQAGQDLGVSTATSAIPGSGIGMVLPSHARNKDPSQRQPATIGKLQEIDLGDEARNRNIERTINARRRMDGEVVEEVAQGGKKKKVRLNRDGSVWVPRKRRGSDDIKRDQLVEAVLRENRLEIYEEPPPEPERINDDQAADDRIAEEFRRDFLDQVSARQRKKAAPAQPVARGPGGKKEEEIMKGPKLGGSRSARAAMREAMLKEKK